jgi:hypothetical protein
VWLTIFGLALLAGVFTFAWWKGDAAARLGSIVYAGAWVVAIAAEWITNDTLPIVPMLALDTFVATGFLVLAIRYNNLWLGAGMMLQGIQLGMHAMYFTSAPNIQLYGFNLFSLVINLISLFILLTIAGAVGGSLYRRARQGQAHGAALLA